MGPRAAAGGVMAGGDATDVIRSVRRYASLMMGSPPWTVRIGRTRATDDQRPVAVVDPAGPLTTLFSRAGGLSQGDVQLGRTLTVMAYPALGATAQDSTIAAEELAALLQAGFERGLVTDDTPPRPIGAPWRIPIFDYDGVPVTGSGRAGSLEPYAYANVTERSFSVRSIQDPLDELRYSVAATIPLTWWRSGRAGPMGPIVRTGGITGTGAVS